MLVLKSVLERLRDFSGYLMFSWCCGESYSSCSDILAAAVEEYRRRYCDRMQRGAMPALLTAEPPYRPKTQNEACVPAALADQLVLMRTIWMLGRNI